jgi:hypothetical protein
MKPEASELNATAPLPGEGAGSPRGADHCSPAVSGSGDRGRPTFSLLHDRAAPAGARYLGALIWVLFIVFPVANAIGKHEPALEHGLVIGRAALFAAS